MPLMESPSPPRGTQVEQSTSQLAGLSMENSQAADRAAQITARNRRRRYIELHPEYLEQESLEIAEPQLYDATVRKFMTAGEREQKGREGGVAAAMANALVGGELRIAQLERARNGSDGSKWASDIDFDDEDEKPQTKEEGRWVWKREMERRFVQGGDVDFDYKSVDENSEFDDLEEEERRRQEEYYDSMTPEWVGEGERPGETGIQDF